MGANIVNAVAEGVAPSLEAITGARAGLRILTNLCTRRVTSASFRLPVEQLAWKGVPGRCVIPHQLLRLSHQAQRHSLRDPPSRFSMQYHLRARSAEPDPGISSLICKPKLS